MEGDRAVKVLLSHPQCPNCYAGYKRHVQEKRTSQIWNLLLHHCYPQDDLNSLKKLFLGKCLKRLFELKAQAQLVFRLYLFSTLFGAML